MKDKNLILLAFAVLLLIFNLSCSSDSVYIDGGVVIGGDDDFICDISSGFSFVGASINSKGEWVACGSKGIAYGNGSRFDYHIISMNTGPKEFDKIVSLNDYGEFIAVFDTGIYYGDLTGYLVQLDSSSQGEYLSAKINNNGLWVVSSDEGVLIGIADQTPVFLDYVANEGEPTKLALNNYDEFVVAGSLQVLYGNVDEDGNVNLYSSDPVSVYYDMPGVDINTFGNFIATGSIQTILGNASETNNKTAKVLRKKEVKVDLSKFKDIPIAVSSIKKSTKSKLKLNYHYTPLFKKLKTRKAIKDIKALVEYHSADINNYGDIIASGYDYLIVNDQNYSPVTAQNEMVGVAIDNNGNWVAVGTYGLYYNNSKIYDAMNSGDYLSFSMDENGNFICATSKSVYTYSYSQDALSDQGPVADLNYPVAADINNGRWISVGNYGVLLWNY
ncbi:hypothetical protein TTHT_1482 [Thermotomaculum hydrothermale]|uniref:Uncharacterized protein n=1 Tax=Thermotomaculum hydrothermale TaxID=981385 RepID=A0A7R6PFW7_9BACT|nr:hypothetical protein [Thermotomaculum hydrothermale]BBB32989.1 hypothetical protein TTHT_1482 [Thermotomaculum hydrothermale]